MTWAPHLPRAMDDPRFALFEKINAPTDPFFYRKEVTSEGEVWYTERDTGVQFYGFLQGLQAAKYSS